ncbi:energy-coupling factor transporter transmembrane component T family protein [Galactobacter valiniphilus]|uniref:energy-coupling factor transporter transmembrane component T family protein n=1 Tax=Galactobacter valiniphilus TaxID=2676122 RepID=UPI003735CF55
MSAPRVALTMPADAAPALPRRAWLARRNPLAVLGAALLMAVPIVASLDAVSSAVVLGAALLALPFASVPPRRVALFAGALLFGGLLTVWGTAIIAPDSGAQLFSVGTYTVSAGSLGSGLLVATRGLAMALPTVVLFGSVDATRLADALAVGARLPARFVLGALGALRLGGVLTEEWRVMSAARRARGLGGAHVFSTAFGFLVQALRRGTRLAVTMDAKGFGGRSRSWARPVRFTWGDAVLVLLGGAVAALAVVLSVGVGAWNVVWG